MMPSAIDRIAVAELQEKAGIAREFVVLSNGLPPPLCVFPPLLFCDVDCVEEAVLVDEDEVLFVLVVLVVEELLEFDEGATTVAIVLAEDGVDMVGGVGMAVSVMMLFDGATMVESCIVLSPMDSLVETGGFEDVGVEPVVVVTTATLQRT